MALYFFNLWQKEEKEKETQKKTHEALEEIKRNLQSLTILVEESVKKNSGAKVDNSLTTKSDALSKRLDATDVKLDTLKLEIQNLKNSLSKVGKIIT